MHIKLLKLMYLTFENILEQHKIDIFLLALILIIY
jgi:hypothetical protein